MFNYPGLTPKPITHAEQFCIHCKRWFTLPVFAREKLHQWWIDEGKGHAFDTVCCSHCGTDNLLVSVGKYDRPNTPKPRCGVQHIVTS